MLGQFNEFTTVGKELTLDAKEQKWTKNWQQLSFSCGIMGCVMGYMGRTKTKTSVLPINMFLKQNVAMLAKDESGALHPENRPR